MGVNRPALAAFADEVNVRIAALVVDEGAETLELFLSLIHI